LEYVNRTDTIVNKKFWEELIASFPLAIHELERKRKNYGEGDR
jgi:hypothetical protein